MGWPEKEINSREVNFLHSQQFSANVDLISGKECHLNAGCTVEFQQGSGLSAQPTTERHCPDSEGKMSQFYKTFRPYFTA